MKKPIYFILAVFVIICYNSTASFAVMDESVLSEDIIDSIEYEREKAKQEYQIYKLEKESQKKTPVRVEAPTVSEKDIVSTGRKKDVIIGIVSIIVAIILSLSLYQLSKKKKTLRAKTHKKEV